MMCTPGGRTFLKLVVASLTMLASVAAVPSLAQGPASFNRTFNSAGQTVSVPFRAWAPPEVERVRGVLFYIPGNGGNTRGITSNAGWQEMARQMGFAVVGVQHTVLPDGNHFYLGTDPINGAANMQSLLDGMAASLGRPEISNAPMLPFGTSAGGWGASMVAEFFPERVLGFVADKGANLSFTPLFPAHTSMPGLFVYGEADEQVSPYYVNDVYQSWRSQGAEVAQIVDWTGHAQLSDHLRNAFIQQVVKERYPAGQLPSLVPGNPLQLVEIPESAAWRGEVPTLNDPNFITRRLPWPEIAPADEYGSGADEASWLLNETMARVYRSHIAVPEGISRTALSITAQPSLWGTVPLQLIVDMAGVSYNGIDIYNGEDFIAHLDYDDDPQYLTYEPLENGLHTFIAVAEYDYNGGPHLASAYTTINVSGVGSRLVGDYNEDGVVDAVDYSVWRNAVEFGELGDPADGNGDGNIDVLDYDLWKRNYGRTLASLGWGSLAGDGFPIPEPTASTLVALASLIVLSLDGRRS